MFGPNLTHALAQTRQVIGVDMQGHGRRRWVLARSASSTWGDDMAVLLKKLGYDEGGRARLLAGRWRGRFSSPFSIRRWFDGWRSFPRVTLERTALSGDVAAAGRSQRRHGGS